MTAIERNARELKPADIPEPVDLVVADVSFISVCKILARVSACAKLDANFLILIKPQFELPRQDVATGGIVTDVHLHEKADRQRPRMRRSRRTRLPKRAALVASPAPKAIKNIFSTLAKHS